MKKLDQTLRTIDRKRSQVLVELHSELRRRVQPIIEDLRFAPWCGYRGPAEQAEALAAGASQATFGQSPHNFRPALAVDVVLDPRHVRVRPHPQDPEYPDLWDDETPDALAAWEALERAAELHGLQRVDILDRATGKKKRDRPHLQLAGWRRFVRQ